MRGRGCRQAREGSGGRGCCSSPYCLAAITPTPADPVTHQADKAAHCAPCGRSLCCLGPAAEPRHCHQPLQEPCTAPSSRPALPVSPLQPALRSILGPGSAAELHNGWPLAPWRYLWGSAWSCQLREPLALPGGGIRAPGRCRPPWASGLPIPSGPGPRDSASQGWLGDPPSWVQLEPLSHAPAQASRACAPEPG